MKNIILASTIFLAGTTAFAGNSDCRKQILSCSTVYQLFDKSTNDGPSTMADVVDLQPEPFDPAWCEASAVLHTDIGTIMLNYEQVSGKVSGFLAINGKETSVETDAQLKSSVRTTKPGDIYQNDPLDIEFVHVSCQILQK